METCNLHNSLMEKIDHIIDKINSLEVKMAELPDRVLERADKKFASKLVEKIVYGMLGAIALGILYALMELVIKKPII
jgi:hypothetical protein